LLKKTCSLSGDDLKFTQETEKQPKLLIKNLQEGYSVGNVLLVSGKTLNTVNKLREYFGDDLLNVTKILNSFNKV
jgi:hypothetical protein